MLKEPKNSYKEIKVSANPHYDGGVARPRSILSTFGGDDGSGIRNIFEPHLPEKTPNLLGKGVGCEGEKRFKVEWARLEGRLIALVCGDIDQEQCELLCKTYGAEAVFQKVF